MYYSCALPINIFFTYNDKIQTINKWITQVEVGVGVGQNPEAFNSQAAEGKRSIQSLGIN